MITHDENITRIKGKLPGNLRYLFCSERNIYCFEYLEYLAELNKSYPVNPTGNDAILYLFGILWFWIPRWIISLVISVVGGIVLHRLRRIFT
jgi:hypothetical protein